MKSTSKWISNRNHTLKDYKNIFLLAIMTNDLDCQNKIIGLCLNNTRHSCTGGQWLAGHCQKYDESEIQCCDRAPAQVGYFGGVVKSVNYDHQTIGARMCRCWRFLQGHVSLQRRHKTGIVSKLPSGNRMLQW